MLRVYAEVGRFRFKKKEYRADFRKELEGIMLRGMIKWVRAAIHAVDGTFPVQTGMAKGSFTNLVEYIEANRDRLDVKEPLAFKIQTVRDEEGKTPEAGAALSKRDNFITILSNPYGPHQARFEWWTEIPHFVFNELNRAPAKLNLIHTTPWHALDAADLAMAEYLTNRLNRLKTQIRPYIIFETR